MIFIANKKPKPFPGLYERLKFVKADKFVKVLNINDYLRFDWSIPENRLRCQPNPELMPAFQCLNTNPPIRNLNQDSAVDLTPDSSIHTLYDENLQEKRKQMSTCVSSSEEDDDEQDELIKRPKKNSVSKKRNFESDDDSSLAEKSNSLGNYTLSQILDGKLAI